MNTTATCQMLPTRCLERTYSENTNDGSICFSHMTTPCADRSQRCSSFYLHDAAPAATSPRRGRQASTIPRDTGQART
ncbi:hypothetical protein BC628DRAFT_1405367 [Trametes gibbosa]|nr:hypothetical protein BC628DRAFT_1405367 [Trametes gibbosa]